MLHARLLREGRLVDEYNNSIVNFFLWEGHIYQRWSMNKIFNTNTVLFSFVFY